MPAALIRQTCPGFNKFSYKNLFKNAISNSKTRDMGPLCLWPAPHTHSSPPSPLAADTPVSSRPRTRHPAAVPVLHPAPCPTTTPSLPTATVSPAAADPKGCSLAFPGVTGDSLLALRPSTSFSAAACQCGVQPARPRSASSVPVPLLHLPCPCAPSPRPPLSTHAARSLARTRARFAQVRVERRRHSISD